MRLKDPRPEWEGKTTHVRPEQDEIINYAMRHPWLKQEEVAQATDSAQSHVGRVLRKQGQEFVDTINALSRHTRAMMDPIELPEGVVSHENSTETTSGPESESRDSHDNGGSNSGQGENPGIPDETTQVTFDSDEYGS